MNLVKLVKCVFSLQKTEVDVLSVLLSSERPLTIHEISQKLNIERPTANRALVKLFYMNLVKRNKVRLNKFGRPTYEYWVDKNELLEKVKKQIEKVLQGA